MKIEAAILQKYSQLYIFCFIYIFQSFNLVYDTILFGMLLSFIIEFMIMVSWFLIKKITLLFQNFAYAVLR